MQSQRERLRRSRLKRHVRPGRRDLLRIAGAIGGKLLLDQAREVGSLPAALRQQRVGARQGPNTPIDGGDIGFDAIGARKPDDGIHQGQCIAGAVIDLARQQLLMFFRLLALGDVDGHAADANDMVGGIDARHRGADAPAHLAVRTADAELALEGGGVGRGWLDGALHMLPVIRVDEAANVIHAELEALWVDAEDAILPVVPGETAVQRIPFP